MLTSNRPYLAGLAVDGANVFWTEMVAGAYSVMMVSAEGGPVQSALASASQPVAIGGGDVYLRSGAGVVSMPIGAGKQPIPFQGFGKTVSADASGVYGASDTGVFFAPLGAGFATSVDAYGKPVGVAVWEHEVYWTSSGSFVSDSQYTEAGILRASTGGTSADALLGGATRWINHGDASQGGAGGGGDGSGGVASPPPGSPHGIAIDGTDVYWTDEAVTWTSQTPQGIIAKMPIGGGEVMTLASDLDRPGDLAIDGAALYWAEPNGTIKKIPLEGGEPVTLVSGQDSPRDVVVDDTSIYWVSGPSGSRTIVRLTPK